MKYEKIKLQYVEYEEVELEGQEDVVDSKKEYEVVPVERELIVPIVEARTKQLQESIRIIGSIVRKIKDDEDILEALSVQFGFVSEDLIDRDTNELIGELKEKELSYWIEIAVFLLEELPDEMFSLVSLLSGIKVEILETIRISQTFEVLEAVVKVNDIEEIGKSLGKFTNQIKNQMRKRSDKKKAEIEKQRALNSKMR